MNVPYKFIVYDLACGHGLLGVVLAYRFADVRVVCVDMERRTCFDRYLGGFQLHGKAAEGEAHPLSNLEFLEQDFTTLREEDIGGSSSFITMIHGCNEATKLAIEMAQKHGAAYAFMPCCIRDGLYERLSCRASGRCDAPYRHGWLGGRTVRSSLHIRHRSKDNESQFAYIWWLLFA